MNDSKKRNGLTITVVFDAESANYGEGYSNLSVLKKMTRGDYKEYSYISRQAMRYSITHLLGWDRTPVQASGGKGDKSVVQFAPSTSIAEYPEIDLFGYMKTTSKKKNDEKGDAITRSAVARLSNAISLEPYNGDTDFLTNMGLASREGLNPSIAQTEVHRSYYCYTLCIDLDRVGVEEEKGEAISKITEDEKAQRVMVLLDAIEYLYRDIKGRRENFAPIFVVGGVYQRKNPYFEHRVLYEKKNLELSGIEDLLLDEDVKKHTYFGLLNGYFANEEELKEKFSIDGIHSTFDKIKKDVYGYYH